MSTASVIVATGRTTLSTVQKMLEGIAPERFARLPVSGAGVVSTNHPAWVYGHLGLYGSHVAKYAGDAATAEAVAAPEGWADLFAMGSVCQDDPDGTIYPAMTTIVEQFGRAYEAALRSVERADDAVFDREQPREELREMWPTVGASINFMLTTHLAVHAGQVSGWRRIEGLGSAFKF
ncbi:MAG: DinB family protein [Planctomycetota bacterium]